MKTITGLFLVLSIGGISLSLGVPRFQDYPLNGNWVPVQQELGGQVLPASLFANQQMELADSNYTVQAESVDKGVLYYGKGKMDIYGREGVNKGKHVAAIYRVEGDELRICYNLGGESYPESFNTKGHRFFFLSVFRKRQSNAALP